MEAPSSATAPLVVTSLAAPVGVRASRIPIRSPARASHVTTTTAGTTASSSVTSANNIAAVTSDSVISSSVSSGSSLRRSTLPSRVPAVPSATSTKDNNGVASVAAKRQPISGMNRRTLPSSIAASTTSSSSDATTAASGTTKRLVGRNSSNGSNTGTTGTTSAAAIIRAKKAAAATAVQSSSSSGAAATGGASASTRTLGTIMGGGRHVDPAQRRARKAAAAAAAAAKAPPADGDIDAANDDTKTKSKVARGELYYPYGRCRYALTAGDSLGSIRAALNKHGWKELKDPNAVTWDLFWSISSRALQPAKMKPSQICNHFQANGCITTKIGLCRNARKVSGHADTFFPRCFAISEPKEMELFEKQYQIQAASAVLLRYLSLADATLHSKDPSIAAAAVPSLMTPTVVWLAMLAIRGHCRKLATALAADANWSPLQPIHPRDATVAASLGSYSFTAPSDDGTLSSSSSSTSGAAPGATHKRRSELDRAEWKSVVKCAESFSGISKLPLVARSKADMESLAAADPNAAPLHDGMDDDDNDEDDGIPASSPNGTSNGDSKSASAVSSPSHGDSKSSDKPKRVTPSKEPSSLPSKSKDNRTSSNGRGGAALTTKTTSKSTASGGSSEVKQRRATATSTKSRDPVWEQNIAAPLFSSRTICEALSVAAELRRVDPQFLFNGEHNVWILKPGGKSRGRGIQCFDTLLSITKYMKKDHKDKWVAQKYMERPLTVYKKKFDIRQWVFVTQFGSCLRLWFYNDCYVRFSSQDFDLTDLSPAIHLTNNSIQGKLADFDTLDFDAKGNMWSSQRFEDFLEANYSTRPIGNGEAKEEKSTKPAKTVWMERLRPQMKQIARYAIECGYGRMKYRSHSFELFGLDYMLDENLTPWLLEVNSSPTLCHIAVEGIVERMTYDLFCVLFAEHQRHLDEEGGRDKVGAVITPSSILERRQSSGPLPSSTNSDINALDATDIANNDASSSSTPSSAASTAPPPSSTSGVAIGSSMRGSKWELINELRLATRPTK